VLALTLHQPWATLVALRLKPIENRPWRPPASLLSGQRFAIHAGKHYDEAGARWIVEKFGADLLKFDFPRGVVVATAAVSSFVTASENPWFFGPVGWNLVDVRRASSPVVRGLQRLWKLDDALVTEVAG
jgi:hypothetical protein